MAVAVRSEMLASTELRCSVRIVPSTRSLGARLEDGGITLLLGVMVDHQVHAIDGLAEVVRLHVHHRNAVEFFICAA
jgi:hypothetical protein